MDGNSTDKKRGCQFSLVVALGPMGANTTTVYSQDTLPDNATMDMIADNHISVVIGYALNEKATTFTEPYIELWPGEAFVFTLQPNGSIRKHYIGAESSPPIRSK